MKRLLPLILMFSCILAHAQNNSLPYENTSVVKIKSLTPEIESRLMLLMSIIYPVEVMHVFLMLSLIKKLRIGSKTMVYLTKL